MPAVGERFVRSVGRAEQRDAEQGRPAARKESSPTGAKPAFVMPRAEAGFSGAWMIQSRAAPAAASAVMIARKRCG